MTIEELDKLKELMDLADRDDVYPEIEYRNGLEDTYAAFKAVALAAKEWLAAEDVVRQRDRTLLMPDKDGLYPQTSPAIYDRLDRAREALRAKLKEIGL